MRIGFIGLGVMGRLMAEHLIAAGHELAVYRGRTDVAAHVCGSAKEVAERSEVVILMVRDTTDVEAALFDPDGVAEGLRAGSLVIEMSSISPRSARGFAEWIEDLGYDYLDATASGGEVGARDGTLTIMVGGRPEVFERARPIFEILGRDITLVGAAGSGQTSRVADQIDRLDHRGGRRRVFVRAGGRRRSDRSPGSADEVGSRAHACWRCTASG